MANKVTKLKETREHFRTANAVLSKHRRAYGAWFGKMARRYKWKGRKLLHFLTKYSKQAREQSYYADSMTLGDIGVSILRHWFNDEGGGNWYAWVDQFEVPHHSDRKGIN